MSIWDCMASAYMTIDHYIKWLGGNSAHLNLQNHEAMHCEYCAILILT